MVGMLLVILSGTVNAKKIKKSMKPIQSYVKRSKCPYKQHRTSSSVTIDRDENIL
jgi:hypothetical protein